MALRELLCQALNTGAGVGALLLRLHEATKSARRQEPCTRPTTSHEATKPGTCTDSAKISPHTKNRRREPRRRPTTSYEARKSASTAGASHDTTCPPKTPHAEARTPAGVPSPTQTRPRTQKTAGASPFGPAPAVRASRALAHRQHKTAKKLAETSASPDQSIGVASSFQTSFA